MSKKEVFINEVESMINSLGDFKFSEDAATYFEALKGSADKEKPALTENGRIVLKFMQDNKDNYNNLFKAKELGEGIGISSRTASGAMRKLCSDGFAEKIGDSPVVYSLTSKGVEMNTDAE